MALANYHQRRDEIEHYFDKTAADTWARLTSDEPVSRIRQTVREGREEMRNTLLSWLPLDLTGLRLLDAGCGTGSLAIEAAQRGAHVIAVDIAPTLIDLARQRIGRQQLAGSVQFEVGDMRELDLGSFDHVVAMDSIIHYDPEDGLTTLQSMAERVRRSIVFTFAPKTPLLATMHAVGQLFPRGDRSPSIVPVAEHYLARQIEKSSAFRSWQLRRRHRIHRGFYISQAFEVSRP